MIQRLKWYYRAWRYRLKLEAREIAWSYREALDMAHELTDLVAFYPSQVVIEEQKARIQGVVDAAKTTPKTKAEPAEEKPEPKKEPSKKKPTKK